MLCTLCFLVIVVGVQYTVRLTLSYPALFPLSVYHPEALVDQCFAAFQTLMQECRAQKKQEVRHGSGVAFPILATRAYMLH